MFPNLFLIERKLIILCKGKAAVRGKKKKYWMYIFSLDMVPAKDGGFGALINGNWSGLRGQLQRKVIDYYTLHKRSLITVHIIIWQDLLQEVDIACTANSGALGNDIMDLAVYVLSDSFGILVQYPVPKTSDYSHIITFSLNVFIEYYNILLAFIIRINDVY